MLESAPEWLEEAPEGGAPAEDDASSSVSRKAPVRESSPNNPSSCVAR